MTFHDYLDIFRNRRIGAMLALGFASGLAAGADLRHAAGPMTVEGPDIKTIGFFPGGPCLYLQIPVGAADGPLHAAAAGRRRGWLLLTQLGLAAAIAGMAFCPPREALWALAALAALVAFLSASQDIVFDAYSTDVLQPAERGVGAAVKVLGYRLAMLVSGGLALWLADRVLGWPQMYLLMAALMAACVLSLLWAPEPDAGARAALAGRGGARPLRDFFSRPARGSCC